MTGTMTINGIHDPSATQKRQGEGQSLWLDNITRTLLGSGQIRRAANLFLPIHERTDGVDGWVSLEVSPLVAHDARGTVAAARALHERAGRPKLFIGIPRTVEGLAAIEECIGAGVPINVTLLFSADQYRAASDAYAGVDVGGLATRLQADGVEAFVESWKDLLRHLDEQVNS